MMHQPVLLGPVLRLVANSTRILDLTLGQGGYSKRFLSRDPDTSVVGVDCDPSQKTTMDHLAGEFPERFRGVQSRWSALDAHFSDGAQFDAVVADIGLCTSQLEQHERGFSFRASDKDALDMRMSGEGATGSELLNSMSKTELTRMLHVLGQEPLRRSEAIAKRIIKDRPITSAGQFARILRTEMGQVPRHLDPATLGFMALRMHVNGELNELMMALDHSCRLLKPDGVLVFVSYHSLEDRVVKKFLQLSAKPRGEEGEILPTLIPGEFVRPDEAELAENSRSSSALLRFAARTDNPYVSRMDALEPLSIKRRI